MTAACVSQNCRDSASELGRRKRPASKINHGPVLRRNFSTNVRLLLIVASLFLFVAGALGQSPSAPGSVTTSQTILSKTSTSATGTAKTTTTTSSSVAPTSTKVVDDDDDDEGTIVVGTGELPKAFDTNIGKGFVSTTCPNFFTVFLEDPEFQKCLPLSAMLQNSKSFFDATKKSGFATTRILDVSCSADFKKCSEKMAYYANEIKSDQRCGPDIAQKNQLAVQAYAAFLAYPSLFKAGCLKSDSGSYCFADAITNVTSPSDAHIYYLALGIRLPGGSRPTCSSCMQESMDIFQQYSGNPGLPLHSTYVPAAQQINIACGPQFVNTTVLDMSISFGQTTLPPAMTSLITLAAFLIAGFLL